MSEPRIEIAARALRQIEHMLGVALSDAEHGAGPDHDPGQIMCDAMGAARELAFEAYQATFDAARPDVDGDAVVEAAMDPEADAVWRMIYDACTGGNGATGFRIFQRALTAARAPAAPDRRAERQARIEAAISACTECGGREFPKRSDCDGCTAAVDEAMEEERSAPADPDAWQPIETAPRDGTSILACHWKNGARGLVYFNRFKEWESVAINNMPTGVGFYPTHWMPLPKPPIEVAKDAKP